MKWINMANLTNQTFKLFLIILVSLFSLSANAQEESVDYDGTYIPKPFYRDYDCSYLESRGCSCDVWNKMVEQYVGKRIEDRGVEVEGLVKNTMRTAVIDNNGAGSCVQNALKQINEAAKALSALMSIFTGTFDLSSFFSSLFDNLLSAALERACSEVNRVTGDWAGRTLGPLTGKLAGLKMSSDVPVMPNKINTNPNILNNLGSSNQTINSNTSNSSDGVFNKALNSVKCLFGSCS